MLITDAWSAVKQGKELTNAETWKNRQAAAGALATFIGTLLLVAKGLGYSVAIDQDTVEALAGGIAAAYGVFNYFLTLATSKRVGVSSEGTPSS